MRVVRIEDVEWTRIDNSHRNGGLEFKNILTGVEGAPENYWLTLAKGDGHFFSPRHRHNFDQFRMCVSGRSSIDPKKFMEPGEIGYFPEGTSYGPQQDAGENVTLVLQFGAASGGGFVSRGQLRKALDELRALGEFKEGVFRREGGAGKKNQDGFEAVWEHVMGRKLQYPEPRYENPIFMNAGSFKWHPTGSEGTWRKTLGVFTERETRLEMVKLDAGAQWSSPPRDAIGIAFVLSRDGACGAEAYGPQTSVEMSAGEQAVFSAKTPTEMLHIVLPMLRSLKMDLINGLVAEAVAAE